MTPIREKLLGLFVGEVVIRPVAVSQNTLRRLQIATPSSANTFLLTKSLFVAKRCQWSLIILYVQEKDKMNMSTLKI